VLDDGVKTALLTEVEPGPAKKVVQHWEEVLDSLEEE